MSPANQDQICSRSLFHVSVYVYGVCEMQAVVGGMVVRI